MPPYVWLVAPWAAAHRVGGLVVRRAALTLVLARHLVLGDVGRHAGDDALRDAGDLAAGARHHPDDGVTGVGGHRRDFPDIALLAHMHAPPALFVVSPSSW